MGNTRSIKNRVLVIDNSVTNLLLFEAMLQQYGMEVFKEQLATSAIENLAAVNPDIIFLDYMMPGMDGIEALQIIKQQCETPVVMISAYQSKALINQALQMGAVDFLIKPFTVHAIFTCCQSVLLPQ